MKQLRPILIMSSNQERHTKWPTHDRLLTIRTFTKPQRQVANSLRRALHTQGLIVVEGVALAFDTGVLDHGAGVGLQAGHGAADVTVDLDNFLDGGRLQQGRGYALFNAEDDAL